MKIVVYHLTHCPFCKRLLEIFDEKDIKYESIVCDEDKEKFKKQNNFPTFPQVFIEDILVGGLSDAKRLLDSGFWTSEDKRLIVEPMKLEKMNESNYLYLKALNFLDSDKEEAKKLLQKALEANPENMSAQDKLESLS